MKHLRQIQHAFLAFALLGLAACQSLGLKPETFNQRTAAGYVLVTGITDGALVLGQAGKITPKDAQNIHDQAVNLKTGLDIAVSLHVSQPVLAEDRLSATLTALTALDAYLKSRSAP